MAEYVSNLIDGLFGLIIITIFIIFIWAKINKTTMMQIYENIIDFIMGRNKINKLNGEKIKQTWQENRTRM
jgi:hypothetical protein